MRPGCPSPAWRNPCPNPPAAGPWRHSNVCHRRSAHRLRDELARQRPSPFPRRAGHGSAGPLAERLFNATALATIPRCRRESCASCAADRHSPGASILITSAPKSPPVSWPRMARRWAAPSRRRAALQSAHAFQHLCRCVHGWLSSVNPRSRQRRRDDLRPARQIVTHQRGKLLGRRLERLAALPPTVRWRPSTPALWQSRRSVAG